MNELPPTIPIDKIKLPEKKEIIVAALMGLSFEIVHTIVHLLNS